jgi:hypothetical protein
MAGAGGMGGTMVDPCKPTSAVVPLPVVVDTVFPDIAHMGLTQGDINGIAITATCPARAPTPVGTCHTVTYTPAANDAAIPWGGAYWLPGPQNWGVMAGKNIAPGATQLTFYAAGAKGGEDVKFVAGGVVGNSGLACADSVSVNMHIILTTTMTKYSIPFNGFTYAGVWGGFAVAIEAQSPGASGDGGTEAGTEGGASEAGASEAGDAGSSSTIKFYVDSIQWEM